MNTRRTSQPALAILIGSVVLAAGCAQKQVHAIVPAYSAPAASLAEIERPMNIAPDTNAVPPVEGEVPPPALPAEAVVKPSLPIPAARSTPPPPRQAPEQPPTEAAAEPAVHPPAPQISPQISAGEQAGYQRKTQDDISLAERNLQGAGGRQLNAEQQDLVEKIRSFLAQSRDAGKDGDWTRAQNLSQKARLLSIELVNSL